MTSMRTYSVFRRGDSLRDPDATRAISEGIAIAPLLVSSPLWLLFRGHWRLAFAVAALAAAPAFVVLALGASEVVALAWLAALNVAVASYAPEISRRDLLRRGYVEDAPVLALDLEHAEALATERLARRLAADSLASATPTRRDADENEPPIFFPAPGSV